MLLENLWCIVTRNYASLVDEGGSLGKTRVFVLFGLIPALIGGVLGFYSPLWPEIIGPLISAIGVLTGFSINAIILLSGHSVEESYDLEIKHVRQTKDFTLYSILVGFSLLIVLIIGSVISNAGFIIHGVPSSLDAATGSQVLSVIVYSLICHYFLVLLSVTHRLYTLVHSDSL